MMRTERSKIALIGLVLILTGCGSGGATKATQTNPGPSLVQVTIGGAPKARAGKVSYSSIPATVKSVGLRVTAADIVPVFEAANVSDAQRQAGGMTLTLAVPPGPARTFGVNAYDGLLATGTVLYQGQKTADVPPNIAVDVSIPLGFLGGSTTAPPMPTGLLASSFAVGQIRLDWPPTEASQSVTGYVIYMAETAWMTSWSAALTSAMRHPGLGCCTFIHDGLVSTKTYYFALATVNATGEAPESYPQVSAIPNGGGAGGGGGGGSTPTAITELATNLLGSTATFNAQVNPNGLLTSAYFEFGATAALGSAMTSQGVGSGTSPVLFSQTQSGLPATTFYRAAASNSAGTTLGSIVSFTFGGGGGEPILLASQLDRPLHIDLDATNVYWSEDNGALASGRIRTVPKAGGPVTVLASGLSNPDDIALDTSFVFVGENRSLGSVWKVSKTLGPAPALISTGLNVPFTVALSSSFGGVVFWLERPNPALGFLMSISTAGASPTTPTTTVGSSTLASQANDLILYEAGPERVFYWPTEPPGTAALESFVLGGALGRMLDSVSSPGSINKPGHQIAADASFVYWAEYLVAGSGGSVKRISRCCPAPANVVTLASGLNNPFAVALDSTHVYWTEVNPPPNGAIKKVPIAGGSVTVLASSLDNPKTLAVDGGFVYWTEANLAPNGAVKKIAK